MIQVLLEPEVTTPQATLEELEQEVEYTRLCNA